MTIETQRRRAPRSFGPVSVFTRALGLAVAAGAVCVVVAFTARGVASGLSAGFGLCLAAAAFACTSVLLARPLRRARPQVMFVAALTLYAVQMVALLAAYQATSDVSELDGVAVGLTILVVALVWQVCTAQAWRRARVLVFDEAATHGG